MTAATFSSPMFASAPKRQSRPSPGSSTRRRPSALLAHLSSALPKSWEPRCLPCPRLPQIKVQTVTEVDPEYTGLSLSDIMADITSHDAQTRFIQGVHHLDGERQAFSSSKLSSDITEPTHILRVHDGCGSRPLDFACHSILLATHFSALNDIAGPSPRPQGTQHLIDIALPFPLAFSILRDYIYTHSVDVLMSSLLPLPKSGLPKSSSEERLIQAFAEALDGTALLARAYTVYAAYSNARQLGLRDATFWRCIQLAWRIITQALLLSRKST